MRCDCCESRLYFSYAEICRRGHVVILCRDCFRGACDPKTFEALISSLINKKKAERKGTKPF